MKRTGSLSVILIIMMLMQILTSIVFAEEVPSDVQWANDIKETEEYEDIDAGGWVSAYSKGDSPRYVNPLNNDLYGIVAEIDTDITVRKFDFADTELNYDTNLATVRKITVGYDGKVNVEYISEPLPISEAYSVADKYNYSFIDYDKRYTEYNDGLVYWGGEYKYADINENLYLPLDYVWRGDEYGYNLGLMTLYDFYSPEDETAERGMCTAIYTVFSDDVDYAFYLADITPFDDNGYAIMKYKEKQYVIKLKRGVITTVFYNNEKIKFDQLPVVENERTLVPLRAIFEKIGADVAWDGDTQTITAIKDDTIITLTINNTTATKNGETIEIDVPAKAINGRTLVPVRFVADCFGVDVQWVQSTQTVLLTSK